MPHRAIRVSLLFALAFNLFATSMPAQDAAKSQQPAQDAVKAQQPAAVPSKSGTVTCTVDTAPKPVSAPLAEALHFYRTGKFAEAVAAYNAIISSGGPDSSGRRPAAQATLTASIRLCTSSLPKMLLV